MFTTIKSNVLAMLATGLMCMTCAFGAHAQSDYYISAPDVTANGGGTVTVPVSLTNAGGIFSSQMEVFLPDGVDIVSIEGTDRVANAEFFNFAQDDQYTDDGMRYRRIIIGNVQNMAASAISGNEGVLVNITFQLPEGEGVYPIQIKNIQYINPPTFVMNYMDDVTFNITAADYYFTFEEMQASCNDTVTVPLNLHNAGGVYSIQIDLFLPDGIEFIEATLGERVSAEFFQYGSEDKYTDDGLRYRRVIFANLYNTNSTLTGNEGTVVNYLLKIPCHAEESYTLRVSNIQYFNPPTYALNYIADAEGTITVNPTILLGDLNHDGNVNTKDLSDLINYLLTGDEGSICMLCGDVKVDNNVNTGDLSALINILLTGK